MEKTLQTKTPLKALVTTVDEADGDYLKAALKESLTLHVVVGPLSSLHDLDEVDLAQTDILIPFIHPSIGRVEMDAMPQLKLIATRSTGGGAT